MNKIFSAKYGQILQKYFKNASRTVKILEEYFKINSISNKPKDLISGIKKIRKIKKTRKNLTNDFNEGFCLIIENIIDNFKDEDIGKFILDNYAITQLNLCAFLVPYIRSEKIEKDNIFNPIICIIKTEYGNDFINILKFINVFNEEIITKNSPIPTPNDIIKNAGSLINNFYPEKFNDSLNIYYLHNFDSLKKYNINFEILKPGEKGNFQKIFNDIYKIIYVFERIKKRKITRYDFCNIFKGEDEKEYLPVVNHFLKNIKLKELKSFNENDDNDNELLKERISILIEEKEKKKEENKQLISELDEEIKENIELKKEIVILKEQLKKLEIKNEKIFKNLSSKKAQIKTLQKSYDTISNELIDLNQKLLEAQDSINNSNFKLKNFKSRNGRYYHHRDCCKKIEEYFYNIISPNNRSKIEKELNLNNGKKKIDLIIEKIKEEYSEYLSKLLNNGIDLVSFLQNINYFRKKINAQLHDKNKTNKETLIDTLTKYYDGKINFKIPLNYMYNNFKNFVEYSFDPDYQLEIELYNSFKLQRKE